MSCLIRDLSDMFATLLGMSSWLMSSVIRKDRHYQTLDLCESGHCPPTTLRDTFAGPTCFIFGITPLVTLSRKGSHEPASQASEHIDTQPGQCKLKIGSSWGVRTRNVLISQLKCSPSSPANPSNFSVSHWAGLPPLCAPGFKLRSVHSVNDILKCCVYCFYL